MIDGLMESYPTTAMLLAVRMQRAYGNQPSEVSHPSMEYVMADPKKRH